MAKYQIYGIGAALVDTEVVVSDEFLKQNQIEKGVMTLVDEPRQAELLNAFSADSATPSTIPLEIIEVQSGSYLDEDDIVRFEDTYGRAQS